MHTFAAVYLSILLAFIFLLLVLPCAGAHEACSLRAAAFETCSVPWKRSDLEKAFCFRFYTIMLQRGDEASTDSMSVSKNSTFQPCPMRNDWIQ